MCTVKLPKPARSCTTDLKQAQHQLRIAQTSRVKAPSASSVSHVVALYDNFRDGNRLQAKRSALISCCSIQAASLGSNRIPLSCDSMECLASSTVVDRIFPIGYILAKNPPEPDPLCSLTTNLITSRFDSGYPITDVLIP